MRNTNVLAKTGVSIMNMILAAASHQDAQARVRDELDTIVGRDRGQPSDFGMHARLM